MRWPHPSRRSRSLRHRAWKTRFRLRLKEHQLTDHWCESQAGLLSVLYPEVDRNELSFTMTQLDQFKLNDSGFRRIQQTLRYLQRGNGVYRCWHYVETTYSLKGVWVHMFFDSAAYLVEQSSERLLVPPW